jgi:flavin-dependent dehydrogenase
VSARPAVFDAAVVGAGPAGAAVARRLSLRGLRVALLERSRFDTPRIGESFAPNVQAALRELGVWPDFLALKSLPSWGTSSLWGGDEAQSHPHMLSPYGCGWHVDRCAFDRMLAISAVAAGASLIDGVAVGRCTYASDGWRLSLRTGDTGADASELRARVLVDATGRRAQVARRLGAQRLLFDRLVGVAVVVTGVEASEQGRLLVEAAPEGWWYSAPLPEAAGAGGRMMAMLMTDADLCGRLKLSDPVRWRAALEAAPATRRRLGAARPDSAPRVHAAHSQRLRRSSTDAPGPWLAVGDAALAVDPISGSGVPRALSTARAAADAIESVLDRAATGLEAIAAYERARDAECTAYLMERAFYYGAEARFDTPFWRRRRVLERTGEGGEHGLAVAA